MFAAEDWKITVNFKAFDQSNKLLCDNKVEQTISKDTDIAYIRYSWGKPEPGVYWTKGSYRWEAWVDGVLLSTAHFYTVNEGEVSSSAIQKGLANLKNFKGVTGNITMDSKHNPQKSVVVEQMTDGKVSKAYTVK